MPSNYQYYVYFLIDPRDSQPFYVGKSCERYGGRLREHLKETAETTNNPHKYYKIQTILRSGLELELLPIYYTYDENHAYEVEAEIIKELGREAYDEGGILTNLNIDQRPPSRKGKIENAASRLKKSLAQKERYRKNPRVVPEYLKSYFSRLYKGKSNLALKGKPSPFSKDELLRRLAKGTSNYVINIRTTPHICPHCNKQGYGNGMKRWHFENCKLRASSP